jgi:hypothetical protein
MPTLELIAQIDWLEKENAALEQRLAVAENLFSRSLDCGGLCVDCRRAIDKWLLHQPGEWVAVRRADLELITGSLDFSKIKNGDNLLEFLEDQISAIGRLKTALETGEEPK